MKQANEWRKIVAVIGAAVALLAGGEARAGDWYVATNGVDVAGGGSNSNPWATINFAKNQAKVVNNDTIYVGTGVFTEVSIDIDKNITIQGQGMDATILQAAASLDTNQARLIFTDMDGGVTLRGMTFRHASNVSGGSGGVVIETDQTPGIFVDGCRFVSNHVGGGTYSGVVNFGARSSAKHTIVNCEFRDNGSFGAPGIATYGSPLVISNCVFVGNRSANRGFVGKVGSGAQGLRLEIYDSSFVSNSCAGSGAAVDSAANLPTIRNCTFAYNSATNNGGAISWSPDARSVFSNDYANLTFYGNRAGFGGAIYGYSFPQVAGNSVTFDNCTVYNNTATNTGGGIYWLYGTRALRSTIVAGNSAPTGPDCYNASGAFTDNSCLIGNNAGSGLTAGSPNANGSYIGTAASPIDPMLNPLADNGGRARTCALQAGSVCVGKGANPLNLLYDQRGPGYPRVFGAAADMGAVEYLPPWREVYFSTNIFYEWYANNGTINNDTPPRVVLANDTYAGTNGEDFVASGKVTPGNVPAGLTAVVTRANANLVLVTLAGAAVSHTSGDNISDLTLTFGNGAFTLGGAASVTNSTKPDLQVQYRDSAATPALSYAGAGYREVAANDGSVSNLPIVVTLVNEHFAGTNGQNLAASGWVTASGLPAGLTLAATKISDFQVNLTLTGAASLPHNVAQNVENVTFQFLDSAFFSQPASAVTDASKGGIFVRFLNPIMNYGGTAYTESVLNDGSMGNTLALTLFGDALTGTNGEDFVAAGKIVVSANVPTGLTARITRTTITNLTAALVGYAQPHEVPNNVTNLAFTFQDSAFANTAASFVTNYARTNLTVTFITNAITYYVATDGVDVGRTGLSPDQAFKTITNALAKCRDAASDVVQIGAGVFGQTNIALSKVVVVRGMGRDLTFLQGGSDTNTTVSRFFTTSGGNNRPIVIRDMTMRYGGGRGSTGDNTGGAIYQGAQSPLYFFNCMIASNCANSAGAIYVHDGNAYYDRLIASNCTFVGNVGFVNEGGAVRIVGGSSASFYGCTFLGNTAKASSGGAIYSQVTLAIHNSTFWGNRSGASAGAIWNHTSNSTMYNSTMASNSAGANAGAIYAGSGASTMSIYNSIIGTNTSVTGSANIQPPNGTAFSVYRSVIYGTYSGANLYDGCITGQDPKVLPPADNGGPVMTCALQSSSPCINAANATTSLAVDQRGYARDATPDIGAFEYGAHDSLARGTVLILY